jgi:TatD DNase family protein
MLTDTHCHINMMIKKEFDVPIPTNFKELALPIITQAHQAGVTRIINVGTSVPESHNCIQLAQAFERCYATIGTHPNDLKSDWKKDIATYKKWLTSKETYKIVGIGEIGLDYHYPNYNKQMQYDGFRAQIELALEHDLAIVIHTRDAGGEVLELLAEYKNDGIRGVIHCFSEDQDFANYALELGFVLGIGGPLTYPKNKVLREIFTLVPLDKIILETDAPFLPPQKIRGKQNSPAQIVTVAEFLAELRGITIEEISKVTQATVSKVFQLPN